MAETQVKTALILSAYDRMSRVVDESVSKSIRSLAKFKENADRISGRGISLQNVGAAIMGSQALRQPIEAFANLEAGATRLRSVMTMKRGLPEEEFRKINKLAIDLGNALPGTTNDFHNMFTEMIRGGLKSMDIVNGTGKAAAYLAIQLGKPYEEIGRGVAKLREAAGVADKDMMKFMDTIQRTANVGVQFEEMQIAFARSAGQLKFLKLQGLDASKEVAALYAMLIKSGATGETVGTGISAAMSAIFDKNKMALANAEAAKLGIRFKFLDDKGNFMGITNMIGQFGRLKGFSQQQIAGVLTPLLGPTGQDIQFIKTLSSGGLPAFREMNKRMNEQGSLSVRVSEELKTLKNIWDSLTGTFTNFLAVFGGSMAPQLKSLANTFNNLTARVGDFMEHHQKLARAIGWTVTIMGGLALTAGAVGLALGAVAKIASFAASGFLMFAKAVSWARFGMWYMTASLKSFATWGKLAAAAQWIFNASLYGCPVVWIIGAFLGLIGVIFLLVKHWDKVKRMLAVFNPLLNVIRVAWNQLTAAVGKLMDQFKPVIEAAKKLWERFKPFLSPAFKLLAIAVFVPIAAAFAMIAAAVWVLIKAFTIIINIYTKVVSVINGVYKRVWNAGAMMFNAGANIVKNIWQGIKSMASKPIDAIKSIIQKIRNFLPFSPAKDGPFRDLHRVRIIETIAATMKPASMVRAMSGTLNSIAAMRPITNSINNLSGARPSPLSSRLNSGALNYAPVINFSGNASAQDKDDIRRILRENADYMFKLMQQKQNRNQFLTY